MYDADDREPAAEARTYAYRQLYWSTARSIFPSYRRGNILCPSARGVYASIDGGARLRSRDDPLRVTAQDHDPVAARFGEICAKRQVKSCVQTRSASTVVPSSHAAPNLPQMHSISRRVLQSCQNIESSICLLCTSCCACRRAADLPKRSAIRVPGGTLCASSSTMAASSSTSTRSSARSGRSRFAARTTSSRDRTAVPTDVRSSPRSMTLPVGKGLPGLQQFVRFISPECGRKRDLDSSQRREGFAAPTCAPRLNAAGLSAVWTLRKPQVEHRMRLPISGTRPFRSLAGMPQ